MELGVVHFNCPSCEHKLVAQTPGSFFPLNRKIRCPHCSVVFYFQPIIVENESPSLEGDDNIAIFLSQLAGNGE